MKGNKQVVIYMTEFYLIDLNNITLYTYRSGYYSEEEHKYIWTEMKEYFTKLDIDISDLNRINKANLSLEIDDKFMQAVENKCTNLECEFKYEGGIFN